MEKSVCVLGGGPYKIGSSVEFDWCCVNAVMTAKKSGFKTIMINYNPETVSTDYDEVDKLYFDELSMERVLDIYEFENPEGIIVSMGGQIPNNLCLPLHKAGVRILGTSPESVDKAEDRNKFSRLLDEIRIDQPEWKSAVSLEDARKFASKVGYPVLLRPSYVLSGAAMKTVFNEKALERYLHKASEVSKDYPVVVSKFIEDAKEIEFDGVAKRGEVLAFCITEHIENAGVHSGDATMVLPPQRVYMETVRRIRKLSERIAKALDITGPFNIQYIAKENRIKVIECNLRASRSFPFVSKVLKRNFIDVATKAILGLEVEKEASSMFDLGHVCVKCPQFSYSRLKGVDPVQSVEMASTGEVACLGSNVYDAYLKALISTGFNLPKKNVLISISGDKNRYRLLEPIKQLEKMGFKLHATENTKRFYERYGVKCHLLHKIHETEGKAPSLLQLLMTNSATGRVEPNVLTYLLKKDLDLVISIPKHDEERKFDDNYIIRRKTIDLSIPILTNVQITRLFVQAISHKKLETLEVKSWDEYS